MKKKWFSVLIMAMLVTMAAFADNEIFTEGIEFIKTTAEQITGDIKGDVYVEANEETALYITDEMESAVAHLRTGGFYYDEIKKLLPYYNEILVSYELDRSDRAMLHEMMASGGDFGLMLEICDFLQMTELDISAAKDIYELMTKQDGTNSIEYAYAMYTDKIDDELSVSDVAYYVSQGIQPEEIASVYEITLKGSKNVREALDEHLAGISWSNIMSEAYSIPPNSFGENATPFDIASVKSIAEKTKASIEDIVKINSNGRPIVNDSSMNIYLNKQRQISEFTASVGDFKNLDFLISEETAEKLSSLTKEEYTELIEQGYSVREVENALWDNKLSIDFDGKLTIE